MSNFTITNKIQLAGSENQKLSFVRTSDNTATASAFYKNIGMYNE